MSKRLFYRWWATHWASDPRVNAMTLCQRGLYREALDLIYLSGGSIPDDFEEVLGMARVCRNDNVTKSDWERIRNVLHKQPDGRLTHKKLLEELERQKKVSTAARANALRRHSGRSASHKPVAISHKPISRRQKLGANNPPKAPPSGGSPQSKLTVISSLTPELDTTAFRAAWSSWLDHKGRAYKPRGQKAQLTRLAKMGHDVAISAIEYSIAQGFKGIYQDRNPKASSIDNKREAQRQGLKEILLNGRPESDFVDSSFDPFGSGLRELLPGQDEGRGVRPGNAKLDSPGAPGGDEAPPEEP